MALEESAAQLLLEGTGSVVAACGTGRAELLAHAEGLKAAADAAVSQFTSAEDAVGVAAVRFATQVSLVQK